MASVIPSQILLLRDALQYLLEKVVVGVLYLVVAFGSVSIRWSYVRRNRVCHGVWEAKGDV